MKVNSTNIQEIDHDAGGLLVTFKNGRQYRYPTVDGDTYGALATEAVNPDGSVGKLFNRLIRGSHEGVEVDV
jgi:hypothetical protein